MSTRITEYSEYTVYSSHSSCTHRLTLFGVRTSMLTSMTAYNFIHTQILSPDVATRKAARRKVIEKAQQLERESYQIAAKGPGVHAWG
jgi:hypothetical protein